MSQKRTVLVTGTSDGSLGSALAIAMKDQDWRVFASARNLAKLGQVKAAGIDVVQMDIGSEESIKAAVEQVKQLTGGSLDALINNAGGGYSMPIVHLDIGKTQQLFELNVFSIIRVTQAFLPLLLESTHGALLINNTSAASLLGTGIPFQGAYAASKAAASSLTESLRSELGPFGIRVINMLTGGVKSTFYANATLPELPADSIYNVAKEAIEASMAGKQPVIDKPDAKVWAKQVAADLSQQKPPYLVVRGANAETSRRASLLPVGTFDSALKKISGIDVLEARLQKTSYSSKF
ncbi:hypothetical protein F66182_7670 [Fusarium sp. NRRL 66182]|nr:hypothetical protein F66182_7670 [Fusarium sp. NRRL 66182]